MAFYVLDDHNNRIAAFDQEGILAVLQQAIADQSLENIDPDSAVASKLRSVINGTTHHIEFVTQAEYNTLKQGGQLIEGCYYFITDDTTAEDIEEALENLTDAVDAAQGDIANLKMKSATVTTWNDLKTYYNFGNKIPVAVFVRINAVDDGYDLFQASAKMREELGSRSLSALAYINASGTVQTINSLGNGTDAIVYYREV